MTTAVTSPAPAPQGHCSRCGKVWTLKERQGVCQWCGHLAVCQNSTTKPRHIKSNGRRKQRQADGNGNGYDQLPEPHLTYYKVACRFNHKAKAEDREDLLHDIIITLADVERNNGHKPFTAATMYRIASRAVADYWRAQYKLNSGLTCCNCSKAQRRKCKDDDLYTQCPKAIKLESLNKPIIDSEGNITELGETIVDPKSLDLDAWERDSLWQIGYKPRLVAIALKLDRGEALTHGELCYLSRLRANEQKRLFE